jgi:hypothetical protein
MSRVASLFLSRVRVGGGAAPLSVRWAAPLRVGVQLNVRSSSGYVPNFTMGGGASSGSAGAGAGARRGFHSGRTARESEKDWGRGGYRMNNADGKGAKRWIYDNLMRRNPAYSAVIIGVAGTKHNAQHSRQSHDSLHDSRRSSL